ncbi:MAG: cation-translocating P-type ATPase [Methanolinea sp.]|jgi:Ca2+-transporting ATPase|nr:cation-translocating P-type ATPase [Methanolinea sp.]
MQIFSFESLSGLSSAEVSRIREEEGYNEIPSDRRRSPAAIVLGVFREPMFLLLVATGAIYFLLGDIQEGLLMLSFVIVIIGITVYQENKTEKALESLRNLSSPRALVIRDGNLVRIPGREVVPGDYLVLSEGDRVPADGVLLYSQSLSIDESLLTGESVPVRKTAGREGMEPSPPGGDDLPFVFSGTLVVQGQGLARVTAIGQKTEMGKIGKSLMEVGREDSLLKREVAGIVRKIAIAGMSLCAVIAVVYGLSHASWVDGILAGITLAMAILPEEFPVVLTVFLALGAWRLSRYNVLTRQVPAVETLGAATVLCVDKTGTLTENRMSVKAFCCNGEVTPFGCRGDETVPDSCHELAEFAILACKKDPFDPMEKALLSLAEGEFGKTEHVHASWELVQEYPLSPELMAMSNVWRSRDGSEFVIAAKGAPEAIADLCHLDRGRRTDLDFQVNALASQGLRILGVAKASFRPVALPDNQHDFSFTFLGLIGFADPVRPGVREGVAECRAAGIRVAMITGDYPLTARSVGAEIGLPDVDHIITGPQLDQLTDGELEERGRLTSIFARVVPAQKLRIVQAHKKHGEVVAMTGDGVNDAPALRAADIGIAMGRRGTDVARESASLVLLDDNFTSIVAAVRMGRRIFDNLKKAMAYIFSIHVPIAGMSLVPVLLATPLVLLPAHIVFLELIIDPACSIVFESEREEEDVMKRPPRKRDEGILSGKALQFGLLQGGVAFGGVLLVYLWALLSGMGEDEARTLTFVTVVAANLGLILINRSWTLPFWETLKLPNRALWIVISGTVLCLALVISLPPMRDLFSFAPVPAGALAVAAGAGVASVLWFEVFKLWKRNAARGIAVTP